MARVLYVEDNADNRMLVRRILMAYGHTVDEASNAPDGLALAEAHKPDLILMDLSMPGMDGIMATHKLRQSPTLRHIPIVALTANVREQDRKLTEEAGCDGFIGKPIDVDTFPDLVSSYLRSPRRDDGQHQPHTTPDDPTIVAVPRDALQPAAASHRDAAPVTGSIVLSDQHTQPDRAVRPTHDHHEQPTHDHNHRPSPHHDRPDAPGR